jgi:hypothetical protein
MGSRFLLLFVLIQKVTKRSSEFDAVYSFSPKISYDELAFGRGMRSNALSTVTPLRAM